MVHISSGSEHKESGEYVIWTPIVSQNGQQIDVTLYVAEGRVEFDHYDSGVKIGTYATLEAAIDAHNALVRDIDDQISMDNFR